MTPQLFVEVGISSALAFLPPLMDTIEARAMLLAVALQESELQVRRQYRSGPARSYFQFELAGIDSVFAHPKSGNKARTFCLALDIGATTQAVYQAIEFNDVLACGFARLLLWTLPSPLPKKGEAPIGWTQYLAAWNPGKPRPDDWEANFDYAWAIVEAA